MASKTFYECGCMEQGDQYFHCEQHKPGAGGPAMSDLIQRLEAQAVKLARQMSACRAERGEPPVDVTDTPFDCADCKTAECSATLLRDAAAALRRLEQADWRHAALLKIRTRCEIASRIAAGETADSIAADYGVPVEFVQLIGQPGYDWAYPCFSPAPPVAAPGSREA